MKKLEEFKPQTKKVRLYINGVRKNDVRPGMTKWQIFVHRVKVFFKVLFWGVIVMCVLVGIFEAGGYANPKSITLPPTEVIKEVEVRAPIMDRIAGCESQGNPKLKGTHFDKNGQVLMRSNNNRTVDIGKYQINTVWFQKATDMGLDLTIEKDNEEMAFYIYKNHGTEPWSASEKCWR